MRNVSVAFSCNCAAIAIAAILASPAAAQDKPTQDVPTEAAAQDEPNVADIVVTGKRLGFATTSQIKRDAPQSVSVLTTTDLRNIPDTVLIDIVRRVPGLQVSQGGGGGIVSIRGLSQVEVRMNGRNFPSAISRTFNIATLPGDLVSGVAVYKTPTADQIEGGIGGVVDFRTRRPFDFDGVAGSLTAKGVYTNLDRRLDPVVSGYLSDRWKLGGGEFGILIGGSFQRQRNGLQVISADGDVLQTNAGGTNVQAPTNILKTYYEYNKNISTGYGSLQWRNNTGLEMSLDLLYNQSKNIGGDQYLLAALSSGTPTGPFTLYPNSNIFKSGTYSDVPVDSAVDRFTDTLRAFQAGYNVTYSTDRVVLSGDIAYSTSNQPRRGAGVDISTTAPLVTHDASVRYPTFVISGIDPKSASAYNYSYFYESQGYTSSDDLAARIDATYKFDGALRSIQTGLRYDRRTIATTNGSVFVGAPAGIAPVSQNPWSQLTPDDLYQNAGEPQPQWSSFGYNGLGSGIGVFRNLFKPAAVTNNPAQAYDGSEKTLASYGMASLVFSVAGIPVDGNVGVRVIKTDLTINATSRIGRGALQPFTTGSSYVNVLPSVNMRLTLANELFLRLSYSKQLSRPNFASLAPITVIDPNSTGVSKGSSGNPDLKPLRADQYDASLEHYFGSDNSVYIAGFYKNVAGFISNAVGPVVVNGATYQVTRPQNRADGYIAGAEIGYRQTFSFLPGALSGLGLQGSYTYVDGSKQANAAGYIVPFEQITRHNYQLSGFYDKYGLRANVNWVWRSRLLEASSGDASGRPDYRNPFGQLDANIVYSITPRFDLIVSGVNLTQSLIRRSFQDSRFFAQNALENRRFLAGFQVKLGGGI